MCAAQPVATVGAAERALLSTTRIVCSTLGGCEAASPGADVAPSVGRPVAAANKTTQHVTGIPAAARAGGRAEGGILEYLWGGWAGGRKAGY
jgi:hypothetical protein